MTQAVVLGRRRRGRAIGPAVAETAKRLEAAGWIVESKVVYRKRELRREAKRAVAAGVDTVVAVGGDGAVLQVVQKLAETKVVLGIVPMGTGNLLATNLGILKDMDAAIEVLLGQHQRVIDVGHVKAAPKPSGRSGTRGRARSGGKAGGKGGAKAGAKAKFFAVACGVGFDADVMKATPKSRKDRLGKLAYFASVIGQRHKVGNVGHEMTIDGAKQTGMAAQIFVANFSGMGLPLEPRLEVKPDDGVLDVIVVRAAGPLEGLLAGWEAIRQRRHGHTSSGRVFRTRARDVRIKTRQPRLVEVDGSVIGTTPVEISIRPAALSVLVPAE